jgi:ADP-ribosylation factor related protein 1
MFSLLEALKETCFRRPELNVCIIGIDGAGKSSILERAKSAFGSRLPPLPLSKITTTVGMNLAKMDLGGCRVTFWDLGGSARIRGLWTRYYAETHAFIFVVDAADADRLREARDAFCAAFDHADLSDAPCLVLANKADAPGACGRDELATLFEIRSRDAVTRRVDLRPCSALTPDNIRDSLQWIVATAKAAGHDAGRPPTPSPPAP